MAVPKNVRGLTPAQCWKVKEVGGPLLEIGEASNRSPSQRRSYLSQNNILRLPG
jgi:hypothetical protein